MFLAKKRLKETMTELKPSVNWNTINSFAQQLTVQWRSCDGWLQKSIYCWAHAAFAIGNIHFWHFFFMPKGLTYLKSHFSMHTIILSLRCSSEYTNTFCWWWFGAENIRFEWELLQQCEEHSAIRQFIGFFVHLFAI